MCERATIDLGDDEVARVFSQSLSIVIANQIRLSTLKGKSPLTWTSYKHFLSRYRFDLRNASKRPDAKKGWENVKNKLLNFLSSTKTWKSSVGIADFV